MFITLSQTAEADLLASATWYDQKAPNLGDRFLAEVEKCYQYILDYPLGCPMLEEGVRRALVRQFSYQILYVPRAADIYVLAVLHCHISPQTRAERSQSD